MPSAQSLCHRFVTLLSWLVRKFGLTPRLVFSHFASMLSVMIKTALRTLFCLASFALLSAQGADTPLEVSMKHIAKAYHQLTLDLKAPQDASKADYVALATTMKTEAQTARGLVPKKAAELPADQQATMVTDYQKSIDDFSAAIDVLIGDLQASQWDAANKQLATLKMQEDDGHKKFRKEEKKTVSHTLPAPETPTLSTTPVQGASSPEPAPPASPPAMQ